MSSRPRGRPALEPRTPSVNIHVRVSSSQYDDMYAKARAARVTMAEWIRTVLRTSTTPTKAGAR